MATLTQRYETLYTQGRERLTDWLDAVDDTDLARRLHPDANTLAWLLQHIGEVELLFVKNVFGHDLTVKAHTIGPYGGRRQQFGSAHEQRALLEHSGRLLHDAIGSQSEADWSRTVTADFGTKSLQEALSLIITHTAYHAGQARLTLHYGTSPPSETRV